MVSYFYDCYYTEFNRIYLFEFTVIYNISFISRKLLLYFDMTHDEKIRSVSKIDRYSETIKFYHLMEN